ncbi:MAG: FadR/GntR family transcriptional regulator [Geminicoccaceae bacterium]
MTNGVPNTTATRPALHGRIVDTLGRRVVAIGAEGVTSLPSEAELASELAVSRTVLREAVKVLTAKGLIESRPKIGISVRSRRYWNLLDPDVLRWYFADRPTHEQLKQVFELRLIFEPQAAAMAADRRDEEQLRRMRRAFRGMALSETSEENIESDLSFHLAILEASGNELLSSLGNVISSALTTLFALGLSTQDDAGNNWLELHEEVLNAIERQDALTAQTVMHQLLEGSLSNAERALSADAPARGKRRMAS